MLIVHIGLPKTGTTSLQTHTFSKLEAEGIIDIYNPPVVLKKLEAFRRGDQSAIPELKEYFSNAKRTIISLEAIVGANPGNWKEKIALNRQIFPKTTRILITLREPAEYLRSIYQQNVAQGNVVSEKQYFLTQENYIAAAPMFRHRLAEIFSVDDFSYRTLLDGYAASFDRVVAVPISEIDKLNFLPLLGLELPPTQMQDLRARQEKGRVENRSFSAFAMKTTFWRERWLNALGVKTRWAVPSQNNFEAMAKNLESRSSIMQRGVMAVLPKWRSVMVHGIDRILPYRKFELQPDTPFGCHDLDNQSVYRMVTSSGGQSYTLNYRETLPI